MAVKRRITWQELPAHVRAWAQDALGAPVVEVRHATGGYSPGVTDALFGADGRAGFVKAVHPSINPESPGLLRAECRVLRGLPAGLPVAAPLAFLDEGEDGWVGVLLEHVDGVQPPLPWTDAAIGAALDSLDELARMLTPSPVAGLPTAAEALAPLVGGWSDLAGVDDLDPWLAERLDVLDQASLGVLDYVTGDTLLHYDLRADNLLLRADGRITVVDWAWGCVGAAWVDPALLGIEFVSAAAPGVDVDVWFARIAATHGIEARLIADLLAGVLGFFERVGRHPDPPGIPTLREFQRFQAAALREWLRRSALAEHLRRG